MKHTNILAGKNINEFTTSQIFKRLEMQLEREVSFPTYQLTEVATARLAKMVNQKITEL
jgi:hypothetical protein